jgi:hypothetical protein
MRTVRYAAAGAAICLALAGCGNSSPSITSGAGDTLRSDVLALTKAVAAHQWSVADQAISQLRADLIAAEGANSLSAQQAQAIHLDIQHVARDLAAHRVAVTPTTPTTSSTHPKPAPRPAKPPKHHDHGNGHDHGHGGEGD